ncbi:MAG: DUF418 domain-containing protein [Deltaproteobacteria bacterium]|nr:DUF418 domain-containing protein [Deltaproteobacteria bacterium]
MNRRIVGIDLARSLAVIGMIIVNFKVVFGQNGSCIIQNITALFEGKAAATFVVLAGVGIALISNSANNHEKYLKIKSGIYKRAVFLFVTGLSYIIIWPADILHFYGFYMLISIWVLKFKRNSILFFSIFLIFSYPFLMLIIDYSQGWDFNMLEYSDLWTIEGFIRNLFYNGFHPVIPWAGFMLIGVWYGKMDLHDDKIVKKSLIISLLVFVLLQLISFITVDFLSNGNLNTKMELNSILGTEPMPPLPVYMISGSSFAILIVSFCILVAKRFHKNIIIDAFQKMGQMALTFYVAHVVIGMGLVEIIYPEMEGEFNITFSFCYALIFSFLCIIFAKYWSKKQKRGPLELIMRFFTG